MKVKSNPFMSQTDPNNPYGPNYVFLTQQTKQNYKYSALSQYIKLQQKDEENKILYGTVLVASLPVSGALSYVFGVGVCGILKHWEYRYPALLHSRSIICPIICLACMGYAYNQASNLYHNKVILPYTTKYLPQAIENGFQDYTISGSDQHHLKIKSND